MLRPLKGKSSYVENIGVFLDYPRLDEERQDKKDEELKRIDEIINFLEKLKHYIENEEEMEILVGDRLYRFVPEGIRINLVIFENLK